MKRTFCAFNENWRSIIQNTKKIRKCYFEQFVLKLKESFNKTTKKTFIGKELTEVSKKKTYKSSPVYKSSPRSEGPGKGSTTRVKCRQTIPCIFANGYFQDSSP
ncbi:hypothetical protein KSP39_PZI006085 [Platanthera zijinensis]|uniref:Uncharacterized protein n=1 Tax=Platanthera zijinensis TaxID=2320716 RepID=A0AAP0GBD7_9ASPA